MVIRPTSLRPAKFPPCLWDRLVVDAGVAVDQHACFVEFRILISVAADSGSVGHSFRLTLVSRAGGDR